MYTNNMDRLFAEGGMNDQGGTVDPVSGNDVPPGSLQNEVRDDIDVKISEGEFVIPADVVRYIGLERLMKLRDEAKQGLSRMAEIGQMGNAQEVENPEALHEDEEGFESEIDDIMKEVDGEQMGEKKFAAGGFNEPGVDLLNKYNIPKTSLTNPALDVRAYKNKEGRVMYITFFNDKPSIQIPAGYEFAGSAGQFIAETKKVDDKKDSVVTATGTVDTSGGGGDGVSVGGGPSVGGSTGVSGIGIGNSAIGIAIGAVANAIANAIGLSNTPNNSIAETTATGIGNTGATTEGLAENAAALSVDDASIAEGVAAAAADAAAVSANNAAATAADAAAAASAAAGNSTGNDGSAGAATSGSPGWAKGGLVAKRTEKPTLAQKRGIASKK